MQQKEKYGDLGYNLTQLKIFFFVKNPYNYIPI